ncbi:MAG: GCN5-related N-acetyltransferase [Nitrosospira sp.]
MNNTLVALLSANMGATLTSEFSADICIAAECLDRLAPRESIALIRPEKCGDFVFSRERIADIGEEIRPLHRAHWDETERHRHGLPFDPDYATFIRYEHAGRYLLFTVRKENRLCGNCAMYLDRSAHTQTLLATEDTLYLLPVARTGRVARCFVGYVENAMRLLGASEIHITVKTVNKAGRFLRMLGYSHVENGLAKILETEKCAAPNPRNPIRS